MPRCRHAWWLILWWGTFSAAPALGEPRHQEDLEYMTLERNPALPSDPQAFQVYLGSAPISHERFFALLEQHDPDFPLVQRVHADKAVRIATLWGGIGLLVAAPLLGATYWTNYSRNPSGVYTRTWMGITIADAVSAVALLAVAWWRKDLPYYDYPQAQEAARAYNERIEGVNAPGIY